MTTPERIRQAGAVYLSLEKTLTETEWAISALPQITKRLHNAETNRTATQESIQSFERNSQDQLERYQDLQHNNVKSFWYRSIGKLDKKIDEEEKAWLKKAEQVETAKARSDEQQREIASAKKIYDECVEAKRVYEETQQRLSTLLDSLFAGPTPAFPSEDTIEQQVTSTRNLLNDLQIQSIRQEQIVKFLKEANEYQLYSLQSLQSSLGLNTYDLFTHGNMANIMVHSRLAEARNCAARAQLLVQEAQKLDPHIPHLGDMQIEQENLVFQIVFDNIFTDMRVRQIIQQSYVKVEHATAVLQQEVLPEVVHKNKSLRAQLQSTHTEMRNLEMALWKERERIVSEVNGFQSPSYGSIFPPSAAAQPDAPVEPEQPAPPYSA
jgi:hypothetical protein